MMSPYSKEINPFSYDIIPVKIINFQNPGLNLFCEFEFTRCRQAPDVGRNMSEPGHCVPYGTR